MRRPQLLAQMALVALLVFAAVSSAHAGVRTVTIAVNGMSCPFCAFGVEKKLKKVDGVGSITIDMKSGTAALAAKEKESINVEQVPEAIKKAGFTPGAIKVEAIGTVRIDEQQRMLFQLRGQNQSFLLVDMKVGAKEQLRSFAETGAMIEIKGVFHRHVDEIPALSPEAVKEISE